MNLDELIWKPLVQDEHSDRASGECCPYCEDEMSLGEYQASGMCTVCYFKALGENMK